MQRASLAVTFVLAVACGGSAPGATCVVGRSEPCACPDGRTGAQTCMPDGTFGVCSCLGSDGGRPGDDAGRPGDGGRDPVDGGRDTDGGRDPIDGGRDTDGGRDPIDGGRAIDGGRGTDAGRGIDAGRPLRTGHVVLLGGHMLQPFDAGRRMLVNAVALSGASGPIRILDYAQFTDTVGWDPRPILRPEIDSGLASRGRSATYTVLESYTELTTRIRDADVLLVYAQWNGMESMMETIATFWRASLVEFVRTGGVIIVLDSTDNGSPSRGFAYEIVNGMGLLNVGSRTDQLTFGTIVDVATATDPVAAGVIMHATPNQVTCFPSASGATIVTFTRSMLCPTALHLAITPTP